MGKRFKRWASSRRGVATWLAAICPTVGMAATGAVSPMQVPGTLVVVLPVALALVWVMATAWEDKTRPATPRFARESVPSGSRQFREDSNARLVSNHGGFLFEKRYYFCGTGCPPIRLSESFAKEIVARREQEPVLVATTPTRRYWTYQKHFIWENQGLDARDVLALLHRVHTRRDQTLKHAHVMLNVAQGQAIAPPRQREPIPREVRQAVYTRDAGCCTECSSNFDIQYDHVIPWSLGGANSIENLQLLCGPCNRLKGANI